MSQTRISDYDVIIFDCDGVIFDSNNLKTSAFRSVPLQMGFPDSIVNNFVEEHKKQGGVSRYVKFRRFITHHLQQQFDDVLYEKLLSSYADCCIALYKKASLTPGAIDFFEKSNARHYVASGGDEEELRKVFDSRGYTKYFINIYGSPKPKGECVKIVVSREVTSKNTVLIGDSVSDFEAARENGIDFIFMSHFSENKDELIKLSLKYKFRTIDTLNDLVN